MNNSSQSLWNWPLLTSWQPEDSDWDEFGNDLYTIPDQVPVQSSNIIPEAPPPNKADEDSKIKAFVDTPALDWQRLVSTVFSFR